MIIKVFFLILSAVFLIADKNYCQEDSNFTSDDIIENLIEETVQDNEDSQVLDNLEYLKENPLNVNSASLKELLRIPTIDLSTALQIADYVKKVGKVFSMNELYLIKGIDKISLQKILPYLTVETIPKNVKTEYQQTESLSLLSKFKVNVRSRIINDMQDRRGFIENKYQGSKYKIYNRIKIEFNKNIQAGILTEKDAGEKSITDFSAYHLAIKDFGFLNKLVLGDYNLEFGQGLALSNPYGFSKGGNSVTSVNRPDRRIIPYLSSEENQFFKGISAMVNFGNYSLTTFFSNHYLDAGIDSGSGEITSLVIDGYHRTENEVAKRRNTKEIFYGGRVDYSFERLLSLGILYYHSEFNFPLQSSSVYDLRGRKFNCYSLAYASELGNIFIFGETAWNNSISTINSFALKMSKDISTIISIRYYPVDYYPLHSSALAESSTKNEIGIYTGINLKTGIGFFNFFIDQYKFPGSTYYNPLPSEGREFYLNYEVRPVRNTDLNIRYKNERKEVTGSYSEQKKLYNQLMQSIKTEFEYNISPKIRLKTRFDYINFLISGAGLKENGLMIYQDIKINLNRNLSAYTRVIFFQTDSYNSRIYQYENDLPGALSSYVLFGSGLRWYALIKYELFNLIILSAKYSETLKPSEKTFGSGYQEINGNLDNRVSIQIDMKL